MKRRIAVSITILLAACATFAARVETPQGQGQNPQQLFSRALIAERGAGDLDQAIQLYQRVAKESTADRTLAAQALLGAARAYQKLGEAAQSRDLYALVLRTYPEQAEQAAIARDNLAPTGIVQGTVMRAGTREPIAEATVSLSGGPLDPEILTQLQEYLKSQGLNVTVSPYGFADPKFTQELTDALGARGSSLANPAWRSIINQLTRATDARFSAKTDSSGRFTIKDIPPGRYTVKSEAPSSAGASPTARASLNPESRYRRIRLCTRQASRFFSPLLRSPRTTRASIGCSGWPQGSTSSARFPAS
jgi:tetratricopeptide (TPR) repeat protein